ncbi:MAG: DUF433 domain-containing protein [Syntrophaceae bacterium]|nr:DUF433 domain-containing protein [Syntrophaceae bacterium]
MSRMITEIIDDEPYEYIPLGEHVVKAKGVCGGRPTFKYTRILIAGTRDRIDAGEDIDEIVAGYRGRVSKNAILEARRIWSNFSKRAAYK